MCRPSSRCSHVKAPPHDTCRICCGPLTGRRRSNGPLQLRTASPLLELCALDMITCLPPSQIPCATLSMLTYYRTSRSLHFPFWAVCSLSGAQPEIWSVGWNPPVHRIAFRLFVAFPFNQRPSSSAPPEGEGAPGSSGPVHSGRHTAQDGSEDVDDRSRLRPDALPSRRFVFGHIVDFMHAFATASRELRHA